MTKRVNSFVLPLEGAINTLYTKASILESPNNESFDYHELMTYEKTP